MEGMMTIRTVFWVAVVRKPGQEKSEVQVRLMRFDPSGTCRSVTVKGKKVETHRDCYVLHRGRVYGAHPKGKHMLMVKGELGSIDTSKKLVPNEPGTEYFTIHMDRAHLATHLLRRGLKVGFQDCKEKFLNTLQLSTAAPYIP